MSGDNHAEHNSERGSKRPNSAQGGHDAARPNGARPRLLAPERTRLFALALAALTLGVMTWVWQKTQSVDPEDHAHIDSALRELRSLDRTVNQDVLRARYQLINTWDPVLRSYRRIEELEAVIAAPPAYLNETTRRDLEREVARYQAAVTRKQSAIERFKYRSADLRSALRYLPAAGNEAAKAAADAGNPELADRITRMLQQTLIYNLSSDESQARVIEGDLAPLAGAGEALGSPEARRRLRTFVLQIRTLLRLKPEMDQLLRAVFDEPVVQHEDNVAKTYYAGYSAAEHVANRYRIVLYAFSIALLAVIAYQVRRLQQTAKALAASNETLEIRVQERTRELDSRNREMRAVLDNVDQALFTVDLEGQLSRERSAALDRWFPLAHPGEVLWTVLGQINPKAANWMQMGWDGLRDGDLPPEVVLDQLPRKLTLGERHFELEYRPIFDDGKLEKVLFVVSDVTQVVLRERRAADQQEQLLIFQHVMRDRPGFGEFFAEAERLIERVLSDEALETAEVMRAVHTLKGNCALYGIQSVAGVCHDLETKLVEARSPLNGDDRARLSEAWVEFANKVRALTGVSREQRVELSSAELTALRQAILSGKSSNDLLRFLRDVEREPAERRLARLSEQLKSLARRLGKGEVVVTTESNDVRLDSERWAPFWASFVHMLRNALDHGVEAPEERKRVGKSSAGHIYLRTRQADGVVTVEITDDGRGIDWAAIRARAAELGCAASTQEELLELLFRGGLSTKEEVTEYSGRGTGISAARNACLDLGGNVTVVSTRGEGTTFRFCIPADDSVQPLTTAA